MTQWPEVVGIIPALAGNTAAPQPRRRPAADHPRSRGEYRPNRLQRSRHEGSSPLSRGIRAKRVKGGTVLGIIPALAGNTIPDNPARAKMPDHPRSRGEYLQDQSEKVAAEGSSPLSRGIHLPPRYRGLSKRIIPALAGNTRLVFI